MRNPGMSSGEHAALYTAAAREQFADVLQLGATATDLLLTQISVYDSYDGENGETHYVCKYGEQFFYALGDNPAQLTYADQGSGYRLARVTLSAGGAMTGLMETLDGIDNTARIQEICGPLTDLAAQLNQSNHSLTPRVLGPEDADEALQLYLNHSFGSQN